MELLNLKLQTQTENGYEKSIQMFNHLIKDTAIIESGIGFHLLFIKSYLHICFTIPEEKNELLAAAVKTFFKDSTIEKITLENTNIEAAEISFSKDSKNKIKNQYQITTDIASNVINTYFQNESDLSGITIWIKPLQKTIANAFKTPSKDIAYKGYTKEDIEKFKTGYVFAQTYIYQTENIRPLISDISTTLKSLEVKDENSYQITNLHRSTLFEILTDNKINTKCVYSLPEILSIMHIPDTQSINFSRVVTNRRKELAPPKEVLNLDESDPSISFFAKTDFKGSSQKIGLTTTDRMRHLYIIGKSGMGKSRLMQNLMKSDFDRDTAVIIIDPHGDVALEALALIPESRIKDTIYFDPSTRDMHIGFNPIEIGQDKSSVQTLTDSFLAIFKKYMGREWTDQIEYILRFVILALIDTNKSTLPNIVNMLSNKNFRRETIERISDQEIKTFWSTSFLAYQDTNSREINKLVNMISQLMTNKSVRYCICQQQSGFSIDEIIKNNKILILNLSIGKLGEWTSSFLGSILITKIWQTMSAQTDPAKRKNLFLYIDEFQHFTTETFVQIFSEARKYGLSITVANQYVTQIPEEIRVSLFGNIGSLITFRLGAEDAGVLAREFEPYCTPNDLMALDQREIYTKISVNGLTSTPFSARSIDLDFPELNSRQNIISYSRNLAKLTFEVEKELAGDFNVSQKEYSSFRAPVLS